MGGGAEDIFAQSRAGWGGRLGAREAAMFNRLVRGDERGARWSHCESVALVGEQEGLVGLPGGAFAFLGLNPDSSSGWWGRGWRLGQRATERGAGPEGGSGVEIGL